MTSPQNLDSIVPPRAKLAPKFRFSETQSRVLIELLQQYNDDIQNDPSAALVPKWDIIANKFAMRFPVDLTTPQLKTKLTKHFCYLSTVYKQRLQKASKDQLSLSWPLFDLLNSVISTDGGFVRGGRTSSYSRKVEIPEGKKLTTIKLIGENSETGQPVAVSNYTTPSDLATLFDYRVDFLTSDGRIMLPKVPLSMSISDLDNAQIIVKKKIDILA